MGLQISPLGFHYSVFATRCSNMLEPLPSSSPLLSPAKVSEFQSVNTITFTKLELPSLRLESDQNIFGQDKDREASDPLAS